MLNYDGSAVLLLSDLTVDGLVGEVCLIPCITD